MDTIVEHDEIGVRLILYIVLASPSNVFDHSVANDHSVATFFTTFYPRLWHHTDSVVYNISMCW